MVESNRPTEKNMTTIRASMTQECEALVRDFGAKPVADLHDLPDFYTFQRGLFHSHRDLDKFMAALKRKQKCAIVSGFNASGSIHIGHKIVFDTNLYFQREYDCDVFIPISDDESYIAGKVKNQRQGLENAMKLAKQLLAFGFDPTKTHFIIDQLYTNIYNYAIKYSTGTTMNQINASFGYEFCKNPGLFFYPLIQTAHVLFPMDEFKYDMVLVPVGPDEDVHLRISRDIAPKFGLNKAAIIHSVFLPGITRSKMSTSRPETAIFLSDTPKQIKKKANKAFSGGCPTMQEHREKGGNCDNDVACIYLSSFLLDQEETDEVTSKFTNGELLCGDVKKLFGEKLVECISVFQQQLSEITDEQVQQSVLRNA
jgi:tryptophanyl-tRNA synthetase